MFLLMRPGDVGTSLVGAFTLATAVALLAAGAAPWPALRSRLWIVHLGFLPIFAPAAISLLVFWFVSFYERCWLWLDFSQRAVPALTALAPCGFWLQSVVLAWLVIVCSAFANAWGIALAYRATRRAALRLDNDDGVVNAGEAEAMGGGGGGGADGDIRVGGVRAGHLSPARGFVPRRTRIALVALGVVLGLIFLCMVWLVTLPDTLDRPDFRRDGVCPAGRSDLFFSPQPEENDLDCCAWQARSTCCRRLVCRTAKPPAPMLPATGKDCGDLLGLLNCAPCRYDAGVFLANVSDADPAVSPWAVGTTLTVCYEFCQQLYGACLAAVNSSEAMPCAWGSGCRIAVNGTRPDGYPNNRTGITAFCTDLGLAVGKYTDCYAGASALSPPHVLVLAALVAVLAAARRVPPAVGG